MLNYTQGVSRVAKSGFFNKKFIVIAISILLIVAIAVGCYFIFKPRVDLDAPYNDTYSLVHNDDFNYVINQNFNVYNALQDLTNVSSENYQTVKQTFKDLNMVIQTVLSQNNFLLENLLFTQDKDGNMLSLQREISEMKEIILKSSADCKTYINQYLTQSAIQKYPDDNAIFRYVQNYYKYYINFSSNLTKYYKLISDITTNYLIDTFTINPLTKYNIKSLYYWANAICINYSTLDIEQNTLSTAIGHLTDFNNSIILNDSTYIKNSDFYDALFSNFLILNFDDIINNLSKNTFDDYISSLDGEQKTSAVALKNNYYLV